MPVVAIEAVALLPGDAVTLIGFGCEEGVHLPAPAEPPPLKFASGAVVGAERALHEGSPVTSKDVEVYSGNYALTAGPAHAHGGAGLCPGDSGGPLFVLREGSMRVAGVNANYTFLPDETDRVGLPITNWHTRLDDDSRHGVGAWLRSKGAVVR